MSNTFWDLLLAYQTMGVRDIKVYSCGIIFIRVLGILNRYHLIQVKLFMISAAQRTRLHRVSFGRVFPSYRTDRSLARNLQGPVVQRNVLMLVFFLPVQGEHDSLLKHCAA